MQNYDATAVGALWKWPRQKRVANIWTAPDPHKTLICPARKCSEEGQTTAGQTWNVMNDTCLSTNLWYCGTEYFCLLHQIYERVRLPSSNSPQGKEMSLPAAAVIGGTAPCFIDIQIYLQAIIKLRASQGYSELWHSYALIKARAALST